MKERYTFLFLEEFISGMCDWGLMNKLLEERHANGKPYYIHISTTPTCNAQLMLHGLKNDTN